MEIQKNFKWNKSSRVKSIRKKNTPHIKVNRIQKNWCLYIHTNSHTTIGRIKKNTHYERVCFLCCCCFCCCFSIVTNQTKIQKFQPQADTWNYRNKHDFCEINRKSVKTFDSKSHLIRFRFCGCQRSYLGNHWIARI